MNILIWIIVTLVLWYVWIWVLDFAFSGRKVKFRLSLKFFLHWFVLVWMLFLYKYFLTYFGWDARYFLENYTISSVLVFVSYVIAIIILISLFHKHIFSNKIYSLLLSGWILFVTIWLWWYFFWINIFVMYYIISAYAEEYLKFWTGNNFMLDIDKRQPSDLIFFCLLIALWFSWIENLFYLWQSIYDSVSWGWNFNLGMIATGRGFVSTMIHLVSSWLIAYLVLFFEQKEHKLKKHIGFLFPILWALVVWVWLHAGYNLILYYQIKWLLIPVVVLCYFVLSYLLFKLDRMYMWKWWIDKKQ